MSWPPMTRRGRAAPTTTSQPGQTVDIYPHFRTANGHYERHYAAFSSHDPRQHPRRVGLLPAELPGKSARPLSRSCTCTTARTCSIRPTRSAAGRGRSLRRSTPASTRSTSAHLPEVLVVGPENTADRIYEYTPTPGDDPGYTGGGGDKYLRFLIEELKPVIDRDLRTVPDAASDYARRLVARRADLGVRRDHAHRCLHAHRCPVAFDVVGQPLHHRRGQSQPAATLAGLCRQRRQRPGHGRRKPTPPTWRRPTATLATATAPTLLYLVQAGGQHNEDYWAQRLPGALRFLLQGL